MKIIFMTQDLISAGGVVRVIANWANYFSKKNIYVEVVSTQNGISYFPLTPRVKWTIAKFIFFKKILFLPYNTYLMYFFLKQRLNSNIIVNKSLFIEPIWFLRKMGLFKNINLIYFAHGGSSDFKNFYLSRPLVAHRLKMIFEAFDKVICLYDDDKDYPKQVKKEKLFFISNPLPFKSEDVPEVQKKNIVLSLGRITKEKGIDTLLFAWKIVEAKVKNWKLQIVGDGKDKDKFKKLSLQLELENVEFIDGTTDVKPYYKKAKIFVIPSLFEGMPMTILEAMACKACVISSKTAGGKKLIVNKDNGLLFSISDSKQLGEEILELIKNKELRITLSNNAYQYVQQYEIENITQKFERILL